jgi:nucleoside recognition membrane protein YjiH
LINGRLLRFLLPSAAGVCIFLLPVITPERQTIAFSLITDALRELLEPHLLGVLVGIIGVSALGAVIYRVSGADSKNPYLRAAFSASWGWVALRCLGFWVACAVAFDAGPALLRLPDTGVVVMHDIGISMFLIFLVGLTLLPLLTEYGLMEFVGGMFGDRFQRWFRLPGRAAIDMSASLVSASSVGLLVTIGQYERGYYSAREASLIACSFSIVSLPFCVLIADVADLGGVFFGWYVTVLTACIICALILARIPPFSRYPDDYVTQRRQDPAQPGQNTPLGAALARAVDGPGPGAYLSRVSIDLVEISANVIAPAMGLATLAAILVFHTPVFQWVAYPLQWVLQESGVAEAAIIAPGFFAGYLDQFMPALLARGLTSDFWRFVLGGLAVTQLVFLSEFGVLVLRSSLPVGLVDLSLVFAIRTLVTAPMLCAGAWVFT